MSKVVVIVSTTVTIAVAESMLPYLSVILSQIVFAPVSLQSNVESERV